MGVDSIHTVGQCNKVSDLLTAKVLASGDFTAGSTTPSVYQITVQNLGPATAKGVSVSDPLPSGIKLSAAPTTTQGSCTGGSGSSAFSCSLGDIAAGGMAVYTISATVTAGPGILSNSVMVSSDATDNIPANISATEMTTVINPPPVIGTDPVNLRNSKKISVAL